VAAGLKGGSITEAEGGLGAPVRSGGRERREEGFFFGRCGRGEDFDGLLQLRGAARALGGVTEEGKRLISREETGGDIVPDSETRAFGNDADATRDLEAFEHSVHLSLHAELGLTLGTGSRVKRGFSEGRVERRRLAMRELLDNIRSLQSEKGNFFVVEMLREGARQFSLS
jgi:hypothetical protein